MAERIVALGKQVIGIFEPIPRSPPTCRGTPTIFGAMLPTTGLSELRTLRGNRLPCRRSTPKIGRPLKRVREVRRVPRATSPAPVTVINAARALGLTVDIDAKERLHGLASIPSPLFAVEQTIIEHYVLIIVVGDLSARWRNIIESVYHGRLLRFRATRSAGGNSRSKLATSCRTPLFAPESRL